MRLCHFDAHAEHVFATDTFVERHDDKFYILFVVRQLRSHSRCVVNDCFRPSSQLANYL